ncbi:MAG: hypothetical protein UV68_C0023G0005 [Candidatus Collierbacteria bacterium GW2011_GWC2_43_12]|uniref:Uncharacterized protein n=1 Tax=Candidatus Collierbacteria bacterium GW2011_GWC2_43_12 TaxID=1618390 RepID=A0A0G1FDP8_9BACT|nr:MAG: hypothetical protein UV68_C0023G0005 [Candidatus Collierbacteria bacterium GW2011_GWC2_43_12]KKT83266.1 MAG: hypothetical protein UW80_C0018G0017 [Microgenomates group bacterium GW2011_GWC1_44_9]OGX18088.1 MAG: hypothetical protein A2105_03650 [Omnitrophica WOR_2 bacterium GWF2_63_9]
MATKSDLRYFIAEKIGDSLSSFTCLQSCTDGSLRIRTENVDDSLAVIEGICDLDGTLRYFQAYDLDDFGQGGSIFIVGGDEEFMAQTIRLWLRCPNISFVSF